MLFAGLRGDEPFYRPPVHGLRHPQIFYYGHTPCLYVNKLRVSGVLDGPVNAYFECESCYLESQYAKVDTRPILYYLYSHF